MSVFGEKLPKDSRGNLETSAQDQFTEPIDVYVVATLDTFTILSDTTVLDDSIDIETTGVTPVAGKMVCIKEGFRFYQGIILTNTPIAGNQYTVTLDSPLDYGFTTAATGTLATRDMDVNGSVTPVVYRVTPVGLDASIEWDILTMSFYIQGTTAMDDGEFGDIAALTKGVQIRFKQGNSYKNIFNFKTNGDLLLDTRNREFSPSPPAGKTSVSASKEGRTNYQHGVAARMTVRTADEFQVVIQDNLSTVDAMYVKLFGHKTD